MYQQDKTIVGKIGAKLEQHYLAVTQTFTEALQIIHGACTYIHAWHSYFGYPCDESISILAFLITLKFQYITPSKKNAMNAEHLC